MAQSLNKGLAFDNTSTNILYPQSLNVAELVKVSFM